MAFQPLHPRGLIVKVEAFARRVAEAAQPSLPSPEESGAGGEDSKAQLCAQPQPCIGQGSVAPGVLGGLLPGEEVKAPLTPSLLLTLLQEAAPCTPQGNTLEKVPILRCMTYLAKSCHSPQTPGYAGAEERRAECFDDAHTAWSKPK